MQHIIEQASIEHLEEKKVDVLILIIIINILSFVLIIIFTFANSSRTYSACSRVRGIVIVSAPF